MYSLSVNLWIYIHISCIFKYNTENHLKFDQQLLGLKLRVNTRFWNSALVITIDLSSHDAKLHDLLKHDEIIVYVQYK